MSGKIISYREVRRKRLSMGLRQYQVAEKARIDRSKYCLWEGGHAVLSEAQAKRLRRALHELIQRRVSEINTLAANSESNREEVSA